LSRVEINGYSIEFVSQWQRAGAGFLLLLGMINPAYAGGKEHTHDEWYVRGGIGFGSLSVQRNVTGTYTTETSRGAYGPESEVSEPATIFHLSIGRSVSSHFLIGGTINTYLSRKYISFDSTFYNEEINDRVLLFNGGLTGDYYFSPDGGAHIGGTLSFAWLKIPSPPKTNYNDFGGVGGSFTAHLGYDFWIASQASLGAMAYFSDARLSGNQSADGVSVKQTITVRSGGIAIYLSFQ
jgi:hypothetical protein